MVVKQSWALRAAGSTIGLLLCARSMAGDSALDARFVSLKDEVCLGEPILVEFVARNNSNGEVQFVIRDNSWSPRGFKFSALDARGRAVEKHSWGGAGGWPVPTRIAPGGTYRRQIVLNRCLAFKRPGRYTVVCEVSIRLSVFDSSSEEPKNQLIPVRQELQITITPSDEQEMQATAEGLRALLDSPDTATRRNAVEALAYTNSRMAAPYLTAALEDDDVVVRTKALEALGRIGDDEAVNAVLKALHSKDETFRGVAASVLGDMFEGTGDLRPSNALRRLLDDRTPSVRRDAVCAVGRIAGTDAIPVLRKMSHDPDEGVRSSVASLLGSVGTGSREAADTLLELSGDQVNRVRLASIDALARVGNERAIQHLTTLLADPDEFVRYHAMEAIVQLRGGKPGPEESRLFDEIKNPYKAVEVNVPVSTLVRPASQRQHNPRSESRVHAAPPGLQRGSAEIREERRDGPVQEAEVSVVAVRSRRPLVVAGLACGVGLFGLVAWFVLRRRASSNSAIPGTQHSITKRNRD